MFRHPVGGHARAQPSCAVGVRSASGMHALRALLPVPLGLQLQTVEGDMSDREPTEPYVYQPFGSVSHPVYNAAGRLWGIGGLPHLVRIEGLTKDEAARILAALKKG